jgi:RNA polymerase sigma factor (TIGR02999 family)
MLYPELRRLARIHLSRERSDIRVSATELVHEAFLRLIGGRAPDWESRTHFLTLAARIMRQVLVDHAREWRSAKRGGGQTEIHLEADLEAARGQAEDLLGLHEALDELATFDERKAAILEMRFFGGMSAEEIGRALGLAAVTVHREARSANAWLRRRLFEQSRKPGV